MEKRGRRDLQRRDVLAKENEAGGSSKGVMYSLKKQGRRDLQRRDVLAEENEAGRAYKGVTYSLKKTRKGEGLESWICSLRKRGRERLQSKG